MKNLTQESWIELISKDENAVIIDSRRPDEWENGIIEDALMIAMSGIMILKMI